MEPTPQIINASRRVLAAGRSECMASDNAERQYLLAREMDMLRGERERTERRLFDSKDSENPEVQRDRAWLDYIHRRYTDLALELDTIEHPEKHSAPNVVSLDDLDREEA